MFCSFVLMVFANVHDLILTFLVQLKLNPSTPSSDQDILSPYNISTLSRRPVMKIERNIRGLSFNPIHKFQTYRQRKEDSEENF